MIKNRKKPWNYGKAIGQKRPLTPNQVRLIKQILDAEGNLRDLALFSTAIDTMLRGVDLLALTVDDVMTHDGLIREEVRIEVRNRFLQYHATLKIKRHLLSDYSVR